MDLPIIQTPLFPRYIWMEEVIYSHIPIATLITAFLVLAPFMELIGYKRRDLRWDRLARSLVFFAMILYSPGAALGTGIPIFIIGLYPEFWARWSNLFFWPLIIQFIFFTIDVIFLFFFYYLPWDRMMDRKRRHIFFGFVTAFFGLAIQAVWDALGSYTLTPGAAFPAVTEAVGWSAQAFFNPTYPFLFFHRFFGNFSYTMLLVGGVLALKYMRARVKSEKDYYGWACDVTFSFGFLSFFAMPIIGYGYAKVIQAKAPVAFHAIMGGHVSGAFTLKMVLILVFVSIAATYLFIRHKNKLPMLAAVTAGFGGLYVVLHLHPALDWLGSAVAWRTAYSLIIVGFLVYLWRMRARGRPITERRWPWLMFAAGMAAFFTFAIGGFVRERSKNPYAVYLQHEKPEAVPEERDRFLFYRVCIGCHHQNAGDLLKIRGENWRARVERERRRLGVDLTDEEAGRIIRYLEENTR